VIKATTVCEKLSHKLSWSHYCELVKIDDELERSFYYQQNIIENWSVPELKRQKDSGLFLRLSASKNKYCFWLKQVKLLNVLKIL
jgi:predicted nuclease of restriction endonuclease-like (RecB) superfamily